jgi:hypothetical protein
MKNQLDKKAKRKTDLVYYSLYSFLLAELAIGGYCIYGVSWIGWDLFEPLTYTIAQGYFMCGVFFYLRNKEETNYKNLADFLKNHYRRKLYKKEGFEPERLDFVREKLIDVKKKILELEKKKNF